MAEAETRLTDNELLMRYRRGDMAAMEMLLSRWERPVWRLLGRLSHNGQEIDDLRQEVFLRVVRAAENYRCDWAFSTLLYRIVVSVARDAQRRSRRQISTCPAMEADPPDNGALPAERAAQSESAALVAAALAKLPSELREPLVLRHYENLTFQETAEVLSLPASTVKSRVQAALRTLRSELRKLGLNEGEAT
jgi:RNA polymerase sigma-70 factor (ECF subfamily)